MRADDPVAQPMEEEQIREALNPHWRASAAGDANAEHDIYEDDAICDYPQSGERIVGRGNLQALRSHHPGKPSGFKVRRIFGRGNLWVTEYTITCREQTAYTVSIMEFRNCKVHETVFRRSFRGAGLAEPMGSADGLMAQMNCFKHERFFGV